MDFIKQIAPFTWDEHDGVASVSLYTSHKYKKELFLTRENEGFLGSGYDWESLAKRFIQEEMPELQEVIDFDPEYMMFYAFSSDRDSLKRFILQFKEACEDNAVIVGIFSKASPQEPISEEAIRSVFKMIGIERE